MTEKEWLTVNNLGGLFHDPDNLNLLPLSERKLRLLACAFCRLAASQVSFRHRQQVEIAEAFADGEATRGQLLAGRAVNPGNNRGTFEESVWAATCPPEGQQIYWGGDAIPAPAFLRCLLMGYLSGHKSGLVREIFGNPFRPVSFDAAWRTSDVMALATGIYDERAFDRMPILADALQDAGCDNDDILNHLRDESATHVRGCWALDLVLDKK